MRNIKNYILGATILLSGVLCNPLKTYDEIPNKEPLPEKRKENYKPINYRKKIELPARYCATETNTLENFF